MMQEHKDKPIPQDFNWQWPPMPVDVSTLHVSQNLVTLCMGEQGKTVTSVLSGEEGYISEQLYREIYQSFNNAPFIDPEHFTSADKNMFQSLERNLYVWFLNNHWVIQPTLPDFGISRTEDTRFYHLLLPAQMMNTLTKLVVNGTIKDVKRNVLEEMSQIVFERSQELLSTEYLETVRLEIEALEQQQIRPDNHDSHDVQAWREAIRNGTSLTSLQEHATTIFNESYQHTRKYFNPNNQAAGLYFMKSVVIGVMQEWHQERQGITHMVPPITWQAAEKNGHTSYNFQTNETTARHGHMHTNSKRYPFQKYVAHCLRLID